MTGTEVRLQCLLMATELAKKSAMASNDVLEVAEKYYAFIMQFNQSPK